LINSSIAKDIGIDYKNGIKWSTTGIKNRLVETYFHELEIEVLNLVNSRIKSKVGFINSNSVGILLAQSGFFDNFIVKFEKYANCFSIDVGP
jgi:hypothetical protein